MSTRAWLAVMTAFAFGIMLGYSMDAVRSMAWRFADWVNGSPPYTIQFGPPPQVPPPDGPC